MGFGFRLLGFVECNPMEKAFQRIGHASGPLTTIPCLHDGKHEPLSTAPGSEMGHLKPNTKYLHVSN